MYYLTAQNMGMQVFLSHASFARTVIMMSDYLDWCFKIYARYETLVTSRNIECTSMMNFVLSKRFHAYKTRKIHYYFKAAGEG